MKRITDPSFRYTPSHLTNVAKTIAKARRELAKQGEKRNVVKLPTKVVDGHAQTGVKE